MKTSLIAIALSLQTGLLFSQEKTDTIRNIELPAAVIKTDKSNLLSEKNKSKLTGLLIQKNNSTQDLPYLLNNISSVVIASDAGTGTGYTGIRIRGADLTRMNVTMNGVPINDAESQATYFVDMPDILSSTKEIEINKGVGNSKNGSGSFGASIAVNNLDVDNVKSSFQFQTNYGSFNTLKTMMKVSTGLLNEKFIATLRLSNVQSDGYIQRSSSDLNGMQLTSKYVLRKNTQLVFNYLNGKEKTGQAWNGVPQDSLETNRTYNELGLKSDGTFYKNQTDNYGQQYYQLFFDTKLNLNFSFGTTLFYTKGKGYYEEYKTDQSYADYYLPDFIKGNDTVAQTDLVRQLWLDNDFYGGRVYANYFSKKLDAGLYLNYNEYKGRHYGEIIWAQYNIDNGYQWYHLNALKKEMNAYGMFDYRFAKGLSLFGDMQVRNVNYTIHGFRKNPAVNHDLNYLFFNPKIKLTYQTEKQIISLLAGIAQKEPNREDYESGILFLPKPEKLFNTELNYSRLINKQITLYATAFLMSYKDQLVLTGKLNDVGAYTRSNVDKSYRAGLELEANWKPECKLVELKGNIALSQNKIKSFSEYIDDYDNGGQLENKYSNTDISFSPALISSAQISIYPLRNMNQSSFKNVSIDMNGKYVGEQYLDNTGNKKRMMKSYFTSDLLCTLPFALKHNTTLHLKGGLYNVFNKQYEANGYTYSYFYNNALTTQNYYYPQAGRRWMLGIGIAF